MYTINILAASSNLWIVGAFSIGALLLIAVLWSSSDLCYHLGICHSKSLPYVDNFVGREEDIRNITEYIDFTSSDTEVVHIVGPPGFGKSTLAKKIGDIFLRKHVHVHYVDMRGVTGMDNFAEKILLNVIDSPNKKTLHRLKKWVQEQYSHTLIIFDNCDEMFAMHSDDFIEAINTLISSPKTNVKYLLTSQKWVADVGNFKLHAIYNLSSEAAVALLSKVAPSLTNDQKIQIAELTGNVPLALDVVGAIFKFPNAPTAKEVIQGLKVNPIGVLSPSKLRSKVDVSIGLAYSYLSPELKELCIDLSYFPDSFDQDSAFSIFDLDFQGYFLFQQRSQLDNLVERSLLQFSHPTKRFHFHQLIRKYFLHIKNGVGTRLDESLKQIFFERKFLLHFANRLTYLCQQYG